MAGRFGGKILPAIALFIRSHTKLLEVYRLVYKKIKNQVTINVWMFPIIVLHRRDISSGCISQSNIQIDEGLLSVINRLTRLQSKLLLDGVCYPDNEIAYYYLNISLRILLISFLIFSFSLSDVFGCSCYTISVGYP